MPVQPFGKADPYYDALRVLSNSNLQGAAIGDTIISGSMLNRIYLWPADGSTLSDYDPTEAGLTAALAAAVSGDTVALPSINIAVSAALTLPAGAALRGLSHKAILTFSGFSGTALTLGAGSFVEGFTLSMTSNGTTAIGINANAADSVINDMDVTASGGSAVNIAIGTGVEVIVDEIWVASNGSSTGTTVAYSNYTRDGSRVWSAVASLPAGQLVDFCPAADGSSIYLMVTPSAGLQVIYQCSNPKAVSPTWTGIAYNGLVTGIGTITQYFNYVLGPMVMRDSTLVTTASVGSHAWIYGEYNGSSWTWTSESNANCNNPEAVGFDSWNDCTHHMYDKNHSLIETIGAVTSTHIYHRTGASRYYAMGSGGNILLRLTSTTLATFGAYSFDSQINNTTVTGAVDGPHIYCTNYSNANTGQLLLSDDGTTFNTSATWVPGWVQDDTRAGGGFLIWIPRNLTLSATMGRQYDRSGNVLDDLTGNYWSLTSLGSQDQTIVGMGLVYV